jgi:hypothetical protein
MSSVVPPLDLTNLNSARYRTIETVEPESIVAPVRSFFTRYQLFFYGFIAGVAATVVGSKVRNTLDSHSSY